MQTYYDGKRRTINGLIYYWRGWTTGRDYALARARNDGYAVEFTINPHIYGTDRGVISQSGYHLWSVSKRAVVKPEGFVF